MIKARRVKGCFRPLVADHDVEGISLAVELLSVKEIRLGLGACNHTHSMFCNALPLMLQKRAQELV